MLRFLREGNRHTKTIWWVLIVITVVTFIGGFVVLFGLDLGGRRAAGNGNVLATLDGDRITRDELVNAMGEQRENWKRQFGNEPADRDEKAIETQAWRSLVTQHLLAREAKQLGLKPTDDQVKFMLQVSPPAAVANLEAFQTNGKFDPQKYQAALRNPENNWAPIEQMERAQLPVRLLEERMLSSVKLSEPELRQAWSDRYDKVDGVIVSVPPGADLKAQPTPADIDRVYQKYHNRFYAGRRANLEVMMVPKTATDEDKRQAKVLAQSVVDRARKGEDFAILAKTYSEGPAADQGGVIPQAIPAAQLGPEMGPYISTLQVGQVSDPIPQPGRYMIFKLLDKQQPAGSPQPSFKLAQIVVLVHASQTALSDQLEKVQAVRDRAAAIHNLGRAAAERGFTTQKSGWYDATNPPQALSTMPDAADWGLDANKGAVSGVFETPDAFAVAQLDERHEPGPMTKEEIGPTLQQVAMLEARVAAAKPKADSIAQALQRGLTLEQAAQSVGLTPTPILGMSREQPDPRLGSQPEGIGALFGAAPGRVVGPLRTVSAWLFTRADRRIPGNPAMYDSTAGQVRVGIIQKKQQSFYAGWITSMRARAKLRDLRDSR